MSKNFKKGVQANLTAKQEYAMEQEIRRQCLLHSKKYEKMWDISLFNALNKTLKIGKKRAKRIYVEMLKQRETMKKCFSDPVDAERFMCEAALDIDFDAFYEECKQEAGVEE